MRDRVRKEGVRRMGVRGGERVSRKNKTQRNRQRIMQTDNEDKDMKEVEEEEEVHKDTHTNGPSISPRLPRRSKGWDSSYCDAPFFFFIVLLYG